MSRKPEMKQLGGGHFSHILLIMNKLLGKARVTKPYGHTYSY